MVRYASDVLPPSFYTCVSTHVSELCLALRPQIVSLPTAIWPNVEPSGFDGDAEDNAGTCGICLVRCGTGVLASLLRASPAEKHLRT